MPIDQNHEYRQDELPSDVFNTNSGDVKVFNGYPVKVIVNNNGTRTLIPTTAAGGGTFNFDYAKATQQSYDELGTYYKGLLDTYAGNVNKVIARITQDYETGMRNENQDTQTARTNQDTAVENNALARGLYQRSNFDQTPYAPNTQAQPATQGFGIPTQNFQKTNDAIDLGLSRYIEKATTDKQRNIEDQQTNLTQKTDDLEQARRADAANLTSQKATQAYNQYAAAPSLA